ncbi:MAG: ABC transporter ATP-binding protein [Bacteroidetes bacterium]|nr:ABC transporter ATP-binding protein [Bacteroidota bacterium]
MSEIIIEIQHLSKYYGHSRGIDDICLNVGHGDFFGFIGPNGAGKSTTIRILLNLIFPSSGSAKIFGLDVVKDSKKIRGRIGYVPSDANLYDKMKVHEFLKFGAAFYGGNNSEARIRELAGLLELDLERKIPELSTGNKKKVNIIQALVHQPDLLILDEPSTGLDPLIQSRLFGLLIEENKRGTTVFFSSHVLSEVQALCRRVAIVREGRIIKSDEISALRDKQLKKVRILFTDENINTDLEIQGIESFHRESPKSIVFMFSGDINELIHKVAGIRIENLSIEEPPLEEIFLHYYQ